MLLRYRINHLKVNTFDLYKRSNYKYNRILKHINVDFIVIQKNLAKKKESCIFSIKYIIRF